jgi:hypothetical protein
MRQVVSQRTAGGFGGPGADGCSGAIRPDPYLARLVKYVPVETVVIWIAIFGSTSAMPYNTDWFAIFARTSLIAGTAGTWLYLRFIADVHDVVQLVISTVAFVIWVHALAVLPFTAFPWYNPVAGALLLPVYTALVPLVDMIPAREPAAGDG